MLNVRMEVLVPIRGDTDKSDEGPWHDHVLRGQEWFKWKLCVQNVYIDSQMRTKLRFSTLLAKISIRAE